MRGPKVTFQVASGSEMMSHDHSGSPAGEHHSWLPGVAVARTAALSVARDHNACMRWRNRVLMREYLAQEEEVFSESKRLAAPMETEQEVPGLGILSSLLCGGTAVPIFQKGKLSEEGTRTLPRVTQLRTGRAGMQALLV